jgi:hypothetical protein
MVFFQVVKAAEATDQRVAKVLRFGPRGSVYEWGGLKRRIDVLIQISALFFGDCSAWLQIRPWVGIRWENAER